MCGAAPGARTTGQSTSFRVPPAHTWARELRAPQPPPHVRHPRFTCDPPISSAALGPYRRRSVHWHARVSRALGGTDQQWRPPGSRGCHGDAQPYGGPQAPRLTESVLRLRAGHLQRGSARTGPQSCPASRPPLPGVGDTEREVVGRCGRRVPGYEEDVRGVARASWA